MIRSRAARKSSICTLIRRSLRAIKPASVQIARMSAPERSSFWLMNSSRSTSSPRDIFDVCRVKIFFLVFSKNKKKRLLVSHNKIKHQRISLTVWILEENLTVNTTGSDQSWVQCFDLVGGHNDLHVTTIIESIQLVQKLQHGSLDFSLTARL